MDEQHQNFDVLRQINHQPHGLTHAPATGQSAGLQRVEAPVRSKQQNLVGCLGVEDKPRAVPILELQFAAKVDMARHSADPSHF